MEEKVITFETNDIIVKTSLDIGVSDVNVPYAFGEEEIYCILNHKYIPIQEYETSTIKNEYEYLYKKDDTLKRNGNEGIFEHGNGFLNCKIIYNRD